MTADLPNYDVKCLKDLLVILAQLLKLLHYAIQVLPTIFTARAYARAVLGVVILSVCPSVCHTRGL